MAITYNNPDEVVKVKHILSLAEHIAEKINGAGSGSSSTSKTTPTLTASITTFSAATDFSGTTMKDSTSLSTLTYNGDGDLFIDRNAYTAGFYFKTYNNASGARVGIGYYTDNPPTFPVTFKVGFTETENYKACAVEITVTA